MGTGKVSMSCVEDGTFVVLSNRWQSSWLECCFYGTRLILFPSLCLDLDGFGMSEPWSPRSFPGTQSTRGLSLRRDSRAINADSLALATNNRLFFMGCGKHTAVSLEHASSFSFARMDKLACTAWCNLAVCCRPVST